MATEHRSCRACYEQRDLFQGKKSLDLSVSDDRQFRFPRTSRKVLLVREPRICFDSFLLLPHLYQSSTRISKLRFALDTSMMTHWHGRRMTSVVCSWG